MRHPRLARHAGVMTAVTVFGVLFAAGPAAADVTVSPASAPQGSGANLSFHVTNEGTAPITEVTLKIPADTPIAEVYPLSVDQWAPKITYRKLAVPLKTIHGATPATEAADTIVWLAVNGTTITPGQSADLTVGLGPLPTLSSMRFTLDTKYADGKAGPSMPATVALTPSDGAATGSHHGTDATSAEDAAIAEYVTVSLADEGPSWAWLSASGWIVAALALLGAGWVAWRGRHRAAEDEPDESPDEDSAPADEDKEPVAAGGASKWSYQG